MALGKVTVLDVAMILEVTVLDVVMILEATALNKAMILDVETIIEAIELKEAAPSKAMGGSRGDDVVTVLKKVLVLLLPYRLCRNGTAVEVQQRHHLLLSGIRYACIVRSLPTIAFDEALVLDATILDVAMVLKELLDTQHDVGTREGARSVPHCLCRDGTAAGVKDSVYFIRSLPPFLARNHHCFKSKQCNYV